MDGPLVVLFKQQRADQSGNGRPHNVADRVTRNQAGPIRRVHHGLGHNGNGIIAVSDTRHLRCRLLVAKVASFSISDAYRVLSARLLRTRSSSLLDHEEAKMLHHREKVAISTPSAGRRETCRSDAFSGPHIA